MQPVNDDMDHLFQQAANHYPLNTQGADFDKLQQRMQAAGDGTPPQKESRRRYSWLLLLLLALPFVCRHYYAPQTAGNKPLASQQQLSKKTAQPTSIADQENSPSVPYKTVITTNQNPSSPNTTSTTNHATKPARFASPGSSDNSLATQQPNSNAGNSFLQKKSNEPTIKTSAATTDNTAQTINKKTRQPASVSNKRKNSNNSSAEEPEASVVAKKIGAKKYLPNENELLPGSTFTATETNAQPDSTTPTDSIYFTNKNIDTISTAIAKTDAVKDSTVSDTTPLVKKQLAKSKKPKSYFYAGLIAGLDYSAVKSIQTAGTGYNAGIIAGYRFGRHWAVETGLLWNFKKYYADGQYASTDKLGLLPHTQVLSIDGSCGMLEIPLNVQYHFTSRKRSHWYAGTGLSSYLMKKEDYYYWYKRYNMPYYSEKEYTNSTQNWFSVLQLSGGYQWQWGKRGNLRAEPYIKLPVSKIGVAQLPLSSAGLNLGYTLPL